MAIAVCLDMKTRLIILAVAVAGSLVLGLYRASADLEVSVGVSIHSTAEFYEPLTPHGTWFEAGSYGRCWHPTGVAAGWRPYCDGYWEWTDCGWYWVSDEPWAWACYHYGSWIDDPNVGWCWVPGVEWAPAWVNWRIGGDYIGWAPCGPRGVVIAPSCFVFVEGRHFSERVQPDKVIVNNTLIFSKSAVSSAVKRENRTFDGRTQDVMVNEGPRVDMVEKATGKKFAALPVREADRQTSVSVPEQIKHQTARPVNPQNPPAVHDKSIPAPEHNLTPGGNPEMPHNVPPNEETPPQKINPPDRMVPQAPSEKIVPPPKKELPLNREKPTPKEVVPQQPSPKASPGPAQPPGKNQGNDSHGKDKDHGGDNL